MIFRYCLMTLMIIAAGAPAMAQQDQDAAATTTVDAAIIVNGKTITQAEIEQATNQILMRQMQQFGGQMGQLDPQMLQQLRTQISHAARNMLIEQALVVDLFDEYKEKVTDEEINERIAQLDAMLAAQGQSLEQMIAGNPQLKMEDLREQISEELAMYKAVEAAGHEVTPTEEEIADFYAENKAQMGQPEQVRASHILIGYEGDVRNPEFEPTEEEKAALKGKAEAALERVEAGEDFAELAKELSTGPSGPEGGDLGFFPRQGAMVEPFAAAAFELEPGETSGIVETPFGFHLIKVTERQEATTPTLESMHQEIFDRLRFMKFSEGRQQLVDNLREDAEIEELDGGSEAESMGSPMPAGHPPLN